MNSNWSYSLETLNSGQNRHFLSGVNLKFNGWHCKIIGHLFYATSSFVHHFKAISEFKLVLQSGNAQFIFCPVTLKFDRWPWKTIGHLFYATSSFVHHFIVICEFNCVTIRKRPIWVQIDDFCSVWPWNLIDDLKKQYIGRSPRRRFLDHAFMLHSTILPQHLAQRGVRRTPLAPNCSGRARWRHLM